MNKKGNKKERNNQFLQGTFLKKNRKGQFFIIAAIVIIMIIISIVTISNYTSKSEEVKLYDLGEEIGIESQHVIDSGTYGGLDSDGMATLLENFANNYVRYIEEDYNLYFVFGNQHDVYVIAYQRAEPEPICVDIYENTLLADELTTNDCDLIVDTGESNLFQVSSDEKKITRVKLNMGVPPDDYNHEFDVNEGQNFYFVIWKKIRGEKQVVTSDT